MAASKRRVSAEQTREHLIAAGLARLEASGIGVTLESVSLEEMVRHAGVPRSSGYAAWQQLADDDQTPQAVYRRELLRRAVVGAGSGIRNDRPMRDAAAHLLQQRHELDPEVLAAELIRVAIAAQFNDAMQRQGYRTAQALSALAASVPDDQVDDELVGWLRDAENAYVTSLAEVFQDFARVTRVRPAPDLDGPHFWRQFATAVLALGEGLFPRLRTSDRATLFGLGGPSLDGTGEWTLFAVGMHALYLRFFVPTPPGSQ